jgi:hypothetical protein
MTRAERLYRKSVGWGVRLALFPVLVALLVSKTLLWMIAAASEKLAEVGEMVEAWESLEPEWHTAPAPRDEDLDEEE